MFKYVKRYLNRKDKMLFVVIIMVNPIIENVFFCVVWFEGIKIFIFGMTWIDTNLKSQDARTLSE